MFLVEKIPRLLGDLVGAPSSHNIPTNSKTFHLEPTTPEEIGEIINKIKNKFTSGEDGVSSGLVRVCGDEIKHILSFIINNSFKYGVFPDQLKMSLIRPIFKRGEVSAMENYRPISLLSSFSKILEQAMSTRLLNFIEECNIMSNSQHAYLKGKSTQSAIYQFTEEILKLLEKNELALGLFLDQSSAYDCLVRELLLRKLECMGIREKSGKWFQSYLTKRQQRVSILKEGKEIKSEVLESKFGIPQGSVLGPILFIVFINDLYSAIPRLITGFSDDANVLISASDSEQLEINAQDSFEQIKSWFTNNKLILNKKKTTAVMFSTNKIRNEKEYIRLDNSDIKLEESTKFLGIYIDQFLKWTSHIESLSMKLSSIGYGIRSLRNYLSQPCLKVVYFANFESLLRYGIIFWGISMRVSEIFVIQKRIVRLMFGLKFLESCRGTFRRNKILTVYGIYLFECLVFLFKNKNIMLQHTTVHNYPTRTLDIHYPRHRLSLSEKHPSYNCIRIYNKLPSRIKMITSLVLFKRKMKEILIELEPYSLTEYFESEFEMEL